ncbi:hypothetical protein HZA98_00525, partial [Candidatus Woesearchaeota archaeon]|nr:hypothetical protein [Candidatus Woesearchaeota archaeon]
KSSIYLGYPLLIGAMVSADADSYGYNLNLVLDDLKRVTNTYYNKAKFMSTRLPECDYGAMKTALNNYIALAGDTSSFALYQSKIEIVDSANKALGGDCPEIF